MNEITRLRRARPDCSELSVDREALFAAIIAQPTDRSAPPASVRRRRGRRRKLVLAVALALLVVLTAGTALAVTGVIGWHDDTRIISDPVEWQKLYRDAQSKLTMPPGVKWPARTLPANSVTSPLQPGGQAVDISQVAWECYWADAIKRGDASAGRRARAALTDIARHHILVAPEGTSENTAPDGQIDGPVAIYADDGGFEHFTKMIADAAAGDPATLIQSCRANGPVE